MPYLQKYLCKDAGMACFSKSENKWYLGKYEVSLSDLIVQFNIPKEEALVLVLTYGS